MNIDKQVKEIISEQLCISIERITDEASITSLGADKLDEVELFMAFEEEFDISIPEEDEGKIITTQDAIEYIKKVKGDMDTLVKVLAEGIKISCDRMLAGERLYPPQIIADHLVKQSSASNQIS